MTILGKPLKGLLMDKGMAGRIQELEHAKWVLEQDIKRICDTFSELDSPLISLQFNAKRIRWRERKESFVQVDGRPVRQVSNSHRSYITDLNTELGRMILEKISQASPRLLEAVYAYDAMRLVINHEYSVVDMQITKLKKLEDAFTTPLGGIDAQNRAAVKFSDIGIKSRIS